MSSNAHPKTRKDLDHARERRPTRPHRGDDGDIEPGPNDFKPVTDNGLIEPVTKDDPATSRQPSVQKEPPRAPGP